MGSPQQLVEPLAIAARHGCHPLRGVATYGDVYQLTYLRGPSVWTYRPILEVWLDLQELEDYPSNLLPGFNERLDAGHDALDQSTEADDLDFLAAVAYRRYQQNLRASGAVDFDDLLSLATNYSSSAGGRTWRQGNFNYDAADPLVGAVGFDDLLLLAKNYGLSLLV